MLLCNIVGNVDFSNTVPIGELEREIDVESEFIANMAGYGFEKTVLAGCMGRCRVDSASVYTMFVEVAVEESWKK